MVSIHLLLAAALAGSTQAQTFQVLHSFAGADGIDPYDGLTIDAAGHLYGNTIGADNCYVGCGTVYKLSRQGSGWILTTLYAFAGEVDGSIPGPVTVARDGSLYGATGVGGVAGCGYGYGCGTVYRLQPPATFCRSVSCPWEQTVLYRFQGCPDLYGPEDVTFDQAGNIFGAAYGGAFGCQNDNIGDGGIYELSPSQGGWSYRLAYQFMGAPTGCNPLGGVILDQTGNLYGATYMCGLYGNGAVYKASRDGSGWIETYVYSFAGETDGEEPFAGVISDSEGNVFGTTGYGGLNSSGVVFELSPLNGSYNYSVLYNFSGGFGSRGRLIMDTAGNLYGSQCFGGANNLGMIFKLTPGGGRWTITDLHDFTGNDGVNPIGNMVFDSSGNLYGTARNGGTNNDGVIWEITP